MEGYKNSKENIEKLRKIAKKVNDYLDPIVEKTFDIKSRLKYIEINTIDFSEAKLKLEARADKSENLGLPDETLEKDWKEAWDEYEKTNQAIKETRPEKNLDFESVVNSIKEIDINRELEKNINEVYKEHDIKNWEEFVEGLNIALKISPSYWENLRKRSETN